MRLPEPSLFNLLADAPLANQLNPHVHALLKHPKHTQNLLTQAKQNGLSGLVYHALNHFNLSPHVDKKTVNGLKYIYYRNLSDNIFRLEALEKLRLDLPSQMPLLVLKGPALIQRVYKNPALRPMVDIDLLTTPTHLPELQTCLQDHGYQSPKHYPDIFLNDRVTFDLHTDPFHTDRIADRHKAVPLNIDKLWQDAVPLSHTPNLLMLGLSHQILTLSVHALKHGYERNIWLFDILYCIKQAQQDEIIAQVEQTCAQSNALPILAHTLHAIETHLQHPPPAVLSKLQKSFPIGRFGRKILWASRQSGDFQILEPLVLSKQFPQKHQQLRFLFSFLFPKLETLTQISGFTGPITRWLSYPYRFFQLFSLGLLQLIKLIYRLIGTKSP